MIRTLCALSTCLLFVPAAAAQQWGNVTGQLVFDGKAAPDRAKLDVTKDQKVCLKNGPVLDEKWVVDAKTLGVKNAVIWLRPADAPAADRMPEFPAAAIHPALAKPPAQDAVIDQPCCQFEPHIIALRAGQTFTTKNSAPIPHNVNVVVSPRSGMTGFNLILPPGGDKSMAQTKPYHTPINIKCDIHPWMQAYAWVFPHPYFAVTDENGMFEIKNAPVGKYNIVVWHEAKGYLGGRDGIVGKPIQIKAAGTDVGKLPIGP